MISVKTTLSKRVGAKKNDLSTFLFLNEFRVLMFLTHDVYAWMQCANVNLFLCGLGCHLHDQLSGLIVNRNQFAIQGVDLDKLICWIWINLHLIFKA